MLTGTASPRRLLFVDNIRWTMIVLVLSMHACVTYSPFGGWYYRDRDALSFGETVSFAVYQGVLQAFFMSLLFFIAGYFASASFERKGAAAFVRERLFRLGVPTLVFMLALGPATEYFISRTWGGGGFSHQWLRHVGDGQILGATGPLWFCAALLAFCLIYAGLRVTAWREARVELSGGWRGSAMVALFIAAMAIATFAVRLQIPEGRAYYNMQLGYFPQYALMFAAGLYACRGGWLASLHERFCLGWGAVALVAGGILFTGLLLIGGAMQGRMADYAGGLNAVSAVKSLWESLICVGFSLGLIALFRRHFDRQGALARWMSANAFGVYFIHPPVLVGIALVLHEAAFEALAKAAVLTVLAALTCFGIVAPLLRRIPLVRAVLA